MCQVTNRSIFYGLMICFKHFPWVLIFVTFLDNEGAYTKKNIFKPPSYKVTKLQKTCKLQSYKVTKVMEMSDKLNTCYYSPGTDKHSCCTHQHYCIFNKNRIQLETDITQLENELHQRIHDLKFIKNEGTNNCADYEATKNRIRILNEDLEHLRKFRNKIIENTESVGYGFI